MKNILWISPYVPYDKVNHAGGKTENFYIKGLSKNGNKIRILSFCTIDEVNKIDLDNYGIENDVILIKRDRLSKIYRALRYKTIESKYNPLNKYGNLVSNNFIICVLKKIKHYQRQNYKPDIIVLEWTESGLIIDKIKKYYPTTKIICWEEDIAYTGYERHINYERSFISRKIWKIKYNNLKKIELQSLNASEHIICENFKDKKILLSTGIEEKKVSVISPYFDDYSMVKNDYLSTSIIFYGNMAREENYASAIWFIKNVMPRVSDLPLKFYIIGANPAIELQNFSSQNVIITGFVEDVREYFKSCMCLVAPLVLGAGIKVKIIESLSAGLPVLTNIIGIEGINATKGKEYLHCESADDYESSIRKLYFDREYAKKVGENAKSFIKQNYNMSNSLGELEQLVKKL